MKYGELKTMVAETVTAHFADFRERREKLAAHPDKVEKILADGAKKAKKAAETTMELVRKAIGVR